MHLSTKKIYYNVTLVNIRILSVDLISILFILNKKLKKAISILTLVNTRSPNNCNIGS